MNEYTQRMSSISDELAAQGVRSQTFAPPAYRFAWRLGIRVRPPLYQPFSTLALGMGTGFGALWGVAMWMLFWRSGELSVSGALAATVAAGALFGLAMAGYYRHRAARLRLPPLDRAS